MADKRMSRRRIAKLTPFEGKCWVFAFFYHKDRGKKGELEADRRTWRDMCKEFPRLLNYDGCR